MIDNQLKSDQYRFDFLKFNSSGLISAIVQDFKSKDVLMLAWMNHQSLSLTLSTGFVHFYSRSRQNLWKKGETSGNVQALKSIKYDCDADCLLLQVDQKGAACHTGAISCFFNDLSVLK